MKITDVEVLLINHPLPTDREAPRPWKPLLVKVNTDEGIYGMGEIGMAYGYGASAGWGMAKDLAKMIIGKDPMNTERIWEDMMKKTFWGQGGGTAIFGGMSGIDMALWDIKGKALGVPLYKLLGGKCRDKLRCYASQIQFGWNDKQRDSLATTEEYAQAAKDAVADGYDALKVDVLIWSREREKMESYIGLLPYDVTQMAESRVAAIREAVGPAVDIIIECHSFTDTVNAIQLARLYEKYNIMFIEEVNTPLNASLTKSFKDKIDIPVAAGERIYSRWGYLPFFNDRSLDVIQPDLGTCGGISEGKKIAEMAHIHDITVQAHVCGSPIATAAALHYETAIPNFCIHEHHRNALLKENIELCLYDYQPKDGYYTVPELPGIGQDLTEKAYSLASKVVIQ